MFNKLRKSLSKPVNRFMVKDINNWTLEDVGDWLNANGLQDISSLFIKNAISGVVLKNLTERDLIDIGINKIGHRKKILAELKKFTEILDIEPYDLDMISESTLTSSYDNSTVRIKFEYDGTIKRMKLPKGSNFADLKDELKTRFDISSRAIIEVMDKNKENEKIKIDDDGWDELINNSDHSIKLFITQPSSRSNSKSLNKSSSSRKPRRKRKYSCEILDALQQTIIIIDEKGIIQYINHTGEELLNYTKKELTGQNIKIIMPEEYAEKHDEYIANYLVTGNAKFIGHGRNVKIVTKKGNYIPVFLQLTESYANHKKLFVGTITDPCEEKKSPTCLLMIREVLCNLVNPAIAITEKGIIQVFNKPAQILWGYSMDEVVGHSINMLMPPEYAEHHDQYMQDYLKTGKSTFIGHGRNVIVLLKDGNVKKVHLTLSEKKDGDQIIFTGIITVL